MSAALKYVIDQKLQRFEPVTLDDGSLVISVEDCKLAGDGDAKKGRYNIRLMIAMDRKQPDRETFNGPTEKPATVRAAGPGDELGILALLLEDIAENAKHIAPVDEERVLELIQTGTRMKGGIVGVIDGPGGKPVAVCVMTTFKWWWSQQFCVQEHVLFVHPDHRRSRHVQDLLQFQRWAVDAWTKSFGYRVYLLCGVLGVNNVREKVMLYRRKFRQVGAAFLYPSPFPKDH
jgi:hypothetical protein